MAITPRGFAPAPATFPAPTGFPAPDPEAGWSGLNSTNFFTGASQPSPMSPTTAPIVARGFSVPAAASATGMEVTGVDGQDIEQGLAKLATVNPELAQQLAAKYQNPEDSGGILGFLGDIVHPFVSFGGKALDVISSTAYIVPNLVHDVVDGGDLHIGEDFTGAFTGSTRHNWNSVFQELGWDQGGLSGFLRAGMGFAMDIGTDPLTWLIPQGAGAHLYEAAAKSSSGVATRIFGKGFEEAVVHAGGSVDDAARGFRALVEPLSVNASEVAQKFGSDAAERGIALAGMGYEGATKSLGGDIMELNEKLYALMTTRDTAGLKLLQSKGMVLSSGTEISGATIKDAVTGIIKDGSWSRYAGEGAEKWRLARMTANMMGGWHAKFAVPFTSIRYVSPFSLPFTRNLGFDGLRRFTMGYSGVKRLTGLALAEADPAKASQLWDASKLWMEKGFNDAEKVYPELIGSLKSRGKNLGSAYWSVSEQVGQLTARLNSASAASRANVAGYWTTQEARHVKASAQRFLNDTMNRVSYGGQTWGRSELKKAAQHMGWAGKATPSAEGSARIREQAIWMDGMPHQTAPDGTTHFLDNDELDAWWWQQEGHQFADDAVEEKAASQQALDHLKEINGSLSAEEKSTLDMFGRIWAGGREEAGKYELFVHDVTGEFTDSGLINSSNVKRWQTGTGEAIAGRNWRVVTGDPESAARLGSSGVTAETISDGDFKAVHLVAGAEGEAVAEGAPAAVRGGNFVVVDHRAGAVLGDQQLLDDIDTEIDEGISKAVDDLGEEYGPTWRAAAEQRSRGEMRTMSLQERNPNADGVIIIEPDGSQHLYMFDHQNVKIVDDAAPSMTSPNSGYFPRLLSKEVRSTVHGEIGVEDRARVFTADVLETQLTRKTKDMTLEEAEAYVRRQLREKGVEIGDDTPIFELNPWRAHDAYGTRMAEDLAAVQFGRWTGRLLAMNQIQPYLLGKAASSPRFEWYLPTSTQKALQKLGKKAVTAGEVLGARQARLELKQHDAYAKSMERINTLMSGWELGLSPDQLTQQAVAARTRTVLASSAEAYLAIQDEIGVTNSTLAAMRRKRALSLQGLSWAVENDIFGGAGKAPMLTELEFRGKMLTGQVKAGADGSLLTKEGGWRRYGTTLDDPSAIDEDIYALEQRLKELDDLDATLKGRMPKGPVQVEPGAPRNMKPGIARPGQAPVPEGYVRVYSERYLRSGETPESVRAGGIKASSRTSERATVWVSEGDNVAQRAKAETGTMGDDEFEVELIIPESELKGRLTAAEIRNGGTSTTRQLNRDILPEEVAGVWSHGDYVSEIVDESLPVLSPRTVGKLSRQTAAAESATAAARRTVQGAVKAEQKKFAELGRLRAQVQRAVTERNRAVAELRGVEAKAKVAFQRFDPEAVGKGWTALRVPGLEGYAMPAYIASEMHWVIEKHGISGIRETWRRWVLGWWKRWATYRWPGFHVRNNFGAWFNNTLGGVNLKHYGFAWRVTRAMEQKSQALVRISDEEFARYGLAKLGFSRGVTYGNVADVLANDGLGRANTLAVAGTHTMADELSDEALRGDGNVVRRGAQFYDRHAREWGAGTEAFHRSAAWARGMEISGGDMYSARAFVMMRHGDYSDLTDTEDAIRDLIPFYKWMRTNTPFQIRSLAENPEILTLPHKAQEAAYAAMGLDPQHERAKMPAWQRQTFAVPLPDWLPFIGSDTKNGHVAYAMLDLPFTDLYKGLTDYLSAGLPIIRNVIESYGVSRSLFTGAPLEGRMKPVAGIFALPGVSQMLTAVGVAKRGADGQLYIDDRMENVLTAWPIYSRFRNFISGDPERLENRWSSIFSMTAGLPVRTLDPEAVTANEAAFYYEEVYPLLQSYKDMGYTFPSVDEMRTAGMLFQGDAPAPSSAEMQPRTFTA